MIDVKIGNSFDLIKELDDNSIDCVVTSPPYWSLRDYGTQPIIFDEDKNCSHDFEMNNFKYEHKRKAEITKVGNSLKSEVHSKDYSEGFCKKCGAWKGQLGLEPSSDLFIKHLSNLFLDVKSKLKDTGSCWVNLGDTYSNSNKNNENANISDKSLCLIPDRFAMKMIDNGWILENKVVWHKCISGNTPIVISSNGKILRTNVKDAFRLQKNNELMIPSSNGWRKITEYTNVGQKEVYRIVLRDGFWITATPEHRLILNNDSEIHVEDLKVGDVLKEVSINLPIENFTNCTTFEHGELIGWFMAKGNYEGKNLLKFSMNVNKKDEAIKLGEFAKNYFNSTYRIHQYTENCIVLVISGNASYGFIKDYINGEGANKKHMTNKVWNTNNEFIKGILHSYLDGDGYYDEQNNRWRIGFTYNREFAEDLRFICKLLGYSFRAKTRWVTNTTTDKKHLSYQGEIRIDTSKQRTNNTEIIEIKKLSDTQNCYDLEVEGTHLFAFPDGSLSHNSNAMPESVKDRLSKSYEMFYHFVKTDDYYIDNKQFKLDSRYNDNSKITNLWHINTKGYKGAHFAVFNKELVRNPILMTCPQNGLVLDPFGGSGTTGEFCNENNRNAILFELNPDYKKLIDERVQINYDLNSFF